MRAASDPAEDRLDRLRTPLLLGVFFASGSAALLYQVIWQRVLALFSGADVFSVTVIVAAFMGGLGFGNLAGGAIADRLSRRRCLWIFAAAELAISLFALLSKAFYYDFLYGRHASLAESTPVLALVLFASVVWPTFFMGISLPLLSRALTREIHAAARTVGSLYGYNTLGAAVGAFATTWILVRMFDFETCLRLGAAVNAACAAAALPLARGLRAEHPAAAPAAAPHAPGGVAGTAVFGVPTWLALYALSGAVALSLEIAWFRALGVMLKSTSFTFGTLLTIYLLGVGGGSLVGSRWVVRDPRHPVDRFLLFQTGVGVYAALSVGVLVAALDRLPVLAPLFEFFGGTEPLALADAIAALAAAPLGVFASDASDAGLARLLLGVYALLPTALIGPPTFLMGLSFPFLQCAVQTDPAFVGRRVGWLQTANIVGSLVGTVVTGFVLLPHLGTALTLRLLAVACGVYALLWLRLRRRRPAGGLAAPAAAIAALALAVAVLPTGELLWTRLHGVTGARVRSAEGAAGVTVLRPRTPGSEAPDGVTVMAGGLELSWIPFGGIHTVLGVVPLMLHPDPRRVAVIGLGSGDTTFAFGGRREVEEIVTIEIVGSELTLLRAWNQSEGYAGLRRLFTDPRFRFVVGDGRSFVRRDASGWDLIEADALRPSSAYSGNLYSLEYFEMLRDNLRAGGMAVTWLPTRRVMRTFLRAFPHVLVLESRRFFSESMAMGSDRPIAFDRKLLLDRIGDPFARAYYREAGVHARPLVRRYLAHSTPRSFGPHDDRSGYVDVNRDLFAKDEFMVGGARPER